MPETMLFHVPAAAATIVTARATAPQLPVPLWLEMIAVIVASASGVLTAREHQLDFVGAIGLAIVCGLGGGLLRDMILQVGNVYILNQPLALPISVAAATTVFAFPVVVARRERIIAFLDIMSVGIYAVMGADKAMVYGFEPTVCIMMGFFTAVGGGMLRDICLGQTPAIFRRGNFYAIAAIAGAMSYVILIRVTGLYNIAALILGTLVTMGLRWLSLRYNIMSPTEIDLGRVVAISRRRRRTADGAAPARSSHSGDALADRRERILRDIGRRRDAEASTQRRRLWLLRRK
ncbi:Uncharacterized protein family UPF0126 [Coriobacterium glomerans PW2]|uniref:Uncharacterized protein family UPF0126 n=1 Tax=Coriobacterium glomerans (strain ATCC 49209 / DSM 20642 / JCM 10262 / PW2) TaxID=700015 RepID=F2N9D1_CORGP|nr:trimeric intracellular cation channel family protein [Coriobacterium glomerans]AEB07879.1 Uncharacterized protein family UPF0126 [Coriobacterium glomerans PW2]